MVDNLAIAISHALLALAIWRLLARDDLDRDPGDEEGRRPAQRKPTAEASDG